MNRKIKTVITPNTSEDEEISNTRVVGIQNGATTLEDSLAVFMKLNLPSDPAVAPLSLYPTEVKTYIHTKNVYTNIHNSFFTVAKTENNSSVLQWRNGYKTVVESKLP